MEENVVVHDVIDGMCGSVCNMIVSLENRIIPYGKTMKLRTLYNMLGANHEFR